MKLSSVVFAEKCPSLWISDLISQATGNQIMGIFWQKKCFHFQPFFMSSKSRFCSLLITEEDMQSISIAFYTETKIKTPFGGCRSSTRQQPVALRFRIWYQETKCWSIATAIPESSDPRINFAMRQNRPDPRRRRVMKEEVRTTSARPALKCFAIAGTIRPKLFLKIKK